MRRLEESKPRITVLMPVYNGSTYIAVAIESVLAQTYQDFELLVINDGSTDDSALIVKSYDDPRVRLINNEQNLGLITTLNRGVKLAKGQYLARMDQDDISLPDRLEKQIKYMEAHPEVAVLGSWAYTIDAKGEVVGELRTPDERNLACFYWRPSPHIHPSVMMRLAALHQAPYDASFPDAEDYALWLCLKTKGMVMSNLPEFLMQYRMHTENISVTRRQSQLESSFKAFRQYVGEYFTFEDFISLIGCAYQVGPLRYAKARTKLHANFPCSPIRLSRDVFFYLTGWAARRLIARRQSFN